MSRSVRHPGRGTRAVSIERPTSPANASRSPIARLADMSQQLVDMVSLSGGLEATYQMARDLSWVGNAPCQ